MTNGETIVLFKSLDELNDDAEAMAAKYNARIAANDCEIEELKAASIALVKSVKTREELNKVRAEIEVKVAAMRAKTAAINADFTAENAAHQKLLKRSRRFIQQLGSH
jgi:hypothetical protein